MKVYIKNYEYKIVEVGEEDNDFFKDDGLILYGLTKYTEQVIKIYKDLPFERKRKTLIHELTHAFNDAYLNSQHLKDMYDEEDICSFMATYSEDILKITNEYFGRLSDGGHDYLSRNFLYEEKFDPDKHFTDLNHYIDEEGNEINNDRCSNICENGTKKEKNH